MSPSRNRMKKRKIVDLYELSSMMEISLLCYIKEYGTTMEYYISFFKAVLDSGKNWEEWIAVNERFNETKDTKLN